MLNPLDVLPHRAPFLFVSAFEAGAPGSGSARWVIDGTEDYLRGHFPGNPIVPGVLVVEALAQTAGVVLSSNSPRAAGGHAGYLAQIDVRFRSAARPPCHVMLNATLVDGLGSLHRFSVSATCGHDRVCDGTLVLAVPNASHDARTPR